MVRPMRPSEGAKKRNSRNGVRKNTRIKQNRIRITPRQIFLISLLLLAFMGSGIGYVWSSFEGTQIGYDLSRLKDKEARLKDFNRKLKVELALLKSPQVLEEAVKGSGLRGPSPEQIVVLP